MNCLRELRCQGLRALKPAAPMVALVVSVLLAGCGGGTTQVETFKPARVVVLGDETSAIIDDGNADGFKYSINDRTSTTAGKCQSLPTFAQAILNLYAMVSKECNPTGIAPKGFILAKVGAKVDDPVTGIGQQLAQVSGALGKSDMVSLMLGANDVIALYEDVRDGRSTNAAAVAEARRRGAHLADAVNAILKTGARALVMTIPDMSLSPYAQAQNKINPGAQALLASLSYEFNAYLRTRIDSSAYDGRNYGLVLSDDIVAAMAKLPSSFLALPAIGTEVACTTASAVDCLTTTLVSGAGASTHLWADDRHLGPEAHNRIGAQAQSRAVNNPF